MRQKYLAVALALFLAATELFAGKDGAAVLPVEGGSTGISDSLLKGLAATGRYTVIDKALTGEINENGLSQAGLLQDKKRMLALGALLRAEKFLISKVEESEDGSLHLTIQLVDVESGQVEGKASLNGKDEEELQSRIPAALLSMVSSPPQPVQSKSELSPFVRSAILPGWGQLYTNHPVRGGLFMAGHALLGLLLYTSVQDYNKAVKSHGRATLFGIVGLAAPNGAAAVGTNVLAQLAARDANDRINQNRRKALVFSMGLGLLYGANLYDGWRLGKSGVAISLVPHNVAIAYTGRF